MKANNVINFPLKDALPEHINDGRIKLVEIRLEYIDELVDYCMENLENDFTSAGFILRDSEIHTKDFIFLKEVMKALLIRYIPGVHHNLHDYIDNAVELSDESVDNQEKA